MDHELEVLGAAHVLCGLLGTFASSPMAASNLFIRDLGGRRPLSWFLLPLLRLWLLLVDIGGGAVVAWRFSSLRRAARYAW